MDWPLTTEEEGVDDDTMQRMRLKWLEYHDQQTGGIMGLLPLVQDMPLRMSETIIEDGLRLYKHMSCILKGCELDESDMDRLGTSADTEVVLRVQPKRLVHPRQNVRCSFI